MTDDWDLKMEDNSFSIIKYPDKIGQDIKMILYTIKGSNKFDRDMGVEWIPIIRYPTEGNIKRGILEALQFYDRPLLVDKIDVQMDDTERIAYVTLEIIVDDENYEIELTIGD